MRSVLVVNPKGGAGKTTVATNLAGALACRGEQVFLWDLDRQRSALGWLSMRPAELPLIRRLDQRLEDELPPALKRAFLVIDSPAGLHGRGLTQSVRHADKVLVPVQPSVFDMAASGTFLEQLREEKPVRKSRSPVGLLGMRVDPRTRAAATLGSYLAQFDLPVLAYLRDSQVYPNAAFGGMSVFDLPPSLSQRDREQWEPVLEWVIGKD